MDNHCGSVSADKTKASFWKKNSKTVPGRSRPRKEAILSKHLQNLTSTSFQNFQKSVNDAWEVGDDEFCTLTGVKICKKVAHSAASKVIKSHRTTSATELMRDFQLEHTDCATSEEKKTEAMPCFESQQEISSPQHQVYVLVSASSPLQYKQFPGRPQRVSNIRKVKAQHTSREDLDRKYMKLKKFQAMVNRAHVNLEELQHLSWSGIPTQVRAIMWRLLSGYLPANIERRENSLERKRVDYWIFVKLYYDAELDEIHQNTYRQIHIDIPRMSPLTALLRQKTVQEMFERILFIWAIRHPACGYVQGINDLVTPFYVVFLQEVLPEGADTETWDVSNLPKETRDIIEADSFWCLSKFLHGIQDYYTFAQPGIQRKVNQLKELIQRMDVELHQHLQKCEVDYLQFSFRWMNNLLMRELPLHCTIRLWDTYLAESDGFSSFHLYVCVAFLLHWRAELLYEKNFQGLMLMLQNLPTQNWTDNEINLLVAEAYRLKYIFKDAPHHLQRCKR